MFGSGRTGSNESPFLDRPAQGREASIPNASNYRSRLSRRSRRLSGFTLLEVMIATAVTLLMMISLVQVFKVIGDSMKQGRAALQMNNSLRSVTTRLRQDLANLTVKVDPASDTSSSSGYFEYFDGAMTDYTAALFATDTPKSNRFGDTDDILMFTARAGSSWFTGQVPEAVVDSTKSYNPLNPNPVIITSQLAEIAVFARPVKSANTSGANFDDVDNNGFPDAFRLHYRVLLIRPDLNTNTSGTERALQGFAIPSNNESPLSMAPFFATCDLSMRRVYDGDGSKADLIAANSLEDLANPANRFAHYQYSLVGLGTNGSCTMPMLVLDPIPSSELTVNSNEPNPDLQNQLAPLRGAVGNYLNPAFVLGSMAVGNDRLGEDVIANNILAFDVKGYDPGAMVIGTLGTDGQQGVGGQNATLGQDGSDDLILTPNDPGYAAAFNGAASGGVRAVSYGEYVDLMWGRKAINSLPFYGLNINNISGYNFATPLSGLDSTRSITDSLKRSGKALTVGNLTILQPTYDTWTKIYESNGTKQGPLQNNSSNGTIDINGQTRKNNNGGTDNATNIDIGSDGLDNLVNGTASGGPDDITERETLPPFPTKLRGVKVSIRIEDVNTRQVKQMSVANEFVTQ